MKLPQNKIRNGKSFLLASDFHSKLDATRELKKIKIENALFGKRKYFIFESVKQNIVFKHGIYEQDFKLNN